jgi:cation-transporting ATPase 13A3/4/5
LGDFQFLFIDLFLIIPVAVFMGRSEASERIHVKRPTASLVSRKILVPLIGQILLQLAWQVAVYYHVRLQSWYTPPIEDPEAKNILSSENTALFLLSNFQYITVAVVFSVGSIYRKPLWTNCKFPLELT